MSMHDEYMNKQKATYLFQFIIIHILNFIHLYSEEMSIQCMNDDQTLIQSNGQYI
jgi:hypothetical protein